MPDAALASRPGSAELAVKAALEHGGVAAGAERRRHTRLLLGGLLAALALAATLGSPVLLLPGLSVGRQGAEVVNLVVIIFVAGCITGGVVSALGAQDTFWRLVELAQPVLGPLLACSAFMFVGPALMLLNKHIMQEMSFPYPLTLSSMGLLASFFTAQGLVSSGRVQVRPETRELVGGSGYWTIVFPIAATRAVTLATGNAVYLFLSVGFIQMLKAFTPAIILVVMVFAQVETPPRPSVLCVLTIVLGTLVEVNGELHATLAGLLLMVTSCIGEAVATVFSQKMLQNFKFSEVETMYYLSLPSFLLLSSVGAVLEWRTLIEAGHWRVFVEHPLVMLAAAALGVGVNFLTLMVVRATSSVTVKILNTLRCIVLVGIGSAFYGEVHTAQQLAGYGVSLVGFVGYNYFQLNPSKADAADAWLSSLADRRGAREGGVFLDSGPPVGRGRSLV